MGPTMASVYPSPAGENAFHSISAKMSNLKGNSASSSSCTNSGSASQVDNDIYLNRLITFKSIFGITYLGRYFHADPRKSRPMLLSVLILYDLLSVAAMMYLEFHAFTEYIYERMFRHSYKKLAMNIVFRSSGYCIVLEYLCIKALTLVRGPALINSISAIGQGVRLNSGSLSRYYLVYLVIAVEAVMSSVAFVLMFQPIINNGTSLHCWLWSIFYGAEGMIYGATKSCICALHMYTSILICQRISENKASLRTCPNFGVMLEDMLQMKHRLDHLNGLLSLTMLFKVVANAILQSSCVCALEDKLHDKVLDIETMLALCLLFVSQLVDELVSCFSSQVISDEMDSLIRSIQEMTAQQCTEFLHLTHNQTGSLSEEHELSQCRAVEDVEYRCLQHICSMKDSFCYNVMGMFDLRSVTVLVILSNVCNYSVLLIQTSDTDT